MGIVAVTVLTGDFVSVEAEVTTADDIVLCDEVIGTAGIVLFDDCC